MKILKNLIIFIIGGSAYYLIEILYDGSSHYSMAIVGGLSFLIGGLLNEKTSKLSVKKQALIITIVILALEYITGCIVNKRLGLNVWDYSDMLCNLHGQICLRFALIWFFIFSPLIIWLDDYLRHILFKEHKPPSIIQVYKELLKFKL